MDVKHMFSYEVGLLADAYSKRSDIILKRKMMKIQNISE